MESLAPGYQLHPGMYPVTLHAQLVCACLVFALVIHPQNGCNILSSPTSKVAVHAPCYFPHYDNLVLLTIIQHLAWKTSWKTCLFVYLAVTRCLTLVQVSPTALVDDSCTDDSLSEIDACDQFNVNPCGSMNPSVALPVTCWLWRQAKLEPGKRGHSWDSLSQTRIYDLVFKIKWNIFGILWFNKYYAFDKNK